METKKSYSNLMHDKEYVHRICCMHSPLAEAIRKKGIFLTE